MKLTFRTLSLGVVLAPFCTAHANLLVNGDLDVTYQQEIVSGFFLPKPYNWENVGNRSIGGPYEDEMSSEPWAGPSPTPVTANGFDVTKNEFNGQDWGVFFKPFTGSDNDGLATGHLYQDVAASAGLSYTMTGWAGAEANALMRDAVFALEFLDAGKSVIGSNVLSLMPTLYVDNGLAFDYKQYSVSGVAPAGTAWARVRASMIDARSNPLGGGQAYVVDDFELNVVPEPVSMIVLAGGIAALLRKKRSAR
ncbi:MAG: hypothetical protein JST30_15725 [Armatimonadetes bacterium]|nr:hypothetical protein [Armatimonadota bacterium]